jgi:hypothetical protein
MYHASEVPTYLWFGSCADAGEARQEALLFAREKPGPALNS